MLRLNAILLLIFATLVGEGILEDKAFAQNEEDFRHSYESSNAESVHAREATHQNEGRVPKDPNAKAHGQLLRPTAGEWSELTDINRDGVISRQEAERSMPHLSRHFNEIDANRDGVVTREEVRVFREKRIQQRLERNRDRNDPRF